MGQQQSALSSVTNKSISQTTFDTNIKQWLEPNKSFYLGQTIHAKDKNNRWYLAIIDGYSEKTKQYRLHFPPYTSCADEWLKNTDTSRFDINKKQEIHISTIGQPYLASAVNFIVGTPDDE